MTTFELEVADAMTGAERVERITAASERDALREAKRRGLLVSRVLPPKETLTELDALAAEAREWSNGGPQVMEHARPEAAASEAHAPKYLHVDVMQFLLMFPFIGGVFMTFSGVASATGSSDSLSRTSGWAMAWLGIMSLVLMASISTAIHLLRDIARNSWRQ